MVSCKTLFIVKVMTFWNFLCNLYNKSSVSIKNIYNYMKDYVNGYHDIWFFISGHTTPISLSNLHNPISANWYFDNSNKELSICASEEVDLSNYKFSWLSAKVRIFSSENKGFEYNIDDFIENFTLLTFDDIVPSLYQVFMCWCASKKYWFNADYFVEFHIIDNTGEDVILNLEEHNDSLCIKHKKICIVVHNDNENENKIITPVEPEKEETPLMEENPNKDD